MTMTFTPIDEPTRYRLRTGEIRGCTKEEIDRIIGFEPNVKDDPSKVKYSWGFRASAGRFKANCGIWDYKGSYLSKTWSTYGPAEVFQKLFGAKWYPQQ
jgi:hypothetical protein